jgi:hypothetical protein
MQIPECFLWFLVMVVTSANMQSANITYNSTTTGDKYCPLYQQQDVPAFQDGPRFIAFCDVKNKQQNGAGDFNNEAEVTGSDWSEKVICLVSVLNIYQPESDKPENKGQLELQGYLHKCEVRELFSLEYEDLKKHSIFVSLVANFRDILVYRYSEPSCDEKHGYNGVEPHRMCVKLFDELEDGQYFRTCVNVTENLRNSCVRIHLNINNCNISSNTGKTIFPLTLAAETLKWKRIFCRSFFRIGFAIFALPVLKCIYMIGLILNCSLIRIFVNKNEMRKDCTLIIINIAIGVILKLVLHSPPTDNFLMNSIHSPPSDIYIFYMIVGLNIYSVMMFSCHNYLTLLPVKNRRNSGCSVLRRYSPHAHALTAAVLACLVPVPLISVLTEDSAVSLYVLIAYCAVPLCYSALFSVGTCLRLGSYVQSVHCGSSDHETLRGSRSKSANTLVALIVVSAVSYVPYFSLPFVTPYIGENVDRFVARATCFLFWLNWLVNPVALYVADRSFRVYSHK